MFALLVSIAATVLDAVMFGGAAILDTISSFVLLIPGIAVAARRLHDINRTAWWILIAFTIIGILLLLYWYIQPGDRGDNRYGLAPLQAPTGADFDGPAGLDDSDDGSGFCADCGSPLEQDANFCQSWGGAG